MIYTKTQTEALPKHRFAFIELEEKDHVLTITLNRPEKKNALNLTMVNELAFALHYAHFQDDVWVVVLQAKGNVFCAGADLKAMGSDAAESGSTIPAPREEVLLGELFNFLHKPSIAKVNGDVYAGGFLLLAGCTFVLASNHVKLGLPEVKRGLFPFQVMESLLQVMPPRKVLDWCIRGYNLDVGQAHEWGLVSKVTIEEAIDRDLDKLLQEILTNAPVAIRMGMEAYHQIHSSQSNQNHQYLREMLFKLLMTEDAREGISAFREKRTPVWKGK